MFGGMGNNAYLCNADYTQKVIYSSGGVRSIVTPLLVFESIYSSYINPISNICEYKKLGR